MAVRLAILLLAITCVLLGAPLRTSGDPFVRVAGHELTLDRQPFHFVGANLAVMHGAKNRDAVETVLAGAAKDGVRVGRVWAFGEGDADAPGWCATAICSARGPRAGWRAAPSSSTASSPRPGARACGSSSRSPTTGVTTAACPAI